MPDYSSFTEAYCKKSQTDEKKRKKLFKKLNKKARKVAFIIGQKYKIPLIYLFGSLLDYDSFRLSSDIDLAVKSIKPEEYLDIWGDLEEGLDHSFDLVQIEKIKKDFRELILKEGEIIYEHEKDKRE